MKILCACEESQAVCKEFRALGHEAYSADIQECSGGFPEWHILGDVLEVLNGGDFYTQDKRWHRVDKWDMLIAFPPCTYLSNAGAGHLFPKGKLNEERYKKGLSGKEFFMKFWNADIEHICIENPTPSKVYKLPHHSCVVQPYEHGHQFSKRTLLWLKNLPTITPTKIITDFENTKEPGNWFNKGGKDRQKNRSKLFPGIARAMAQQWGKPFEYKYQPSLLDL